MTKNTYKAYTTDLESKFGAGELVLFLFRGDLVDGIVTDASFYHINNEFMYTIEHEYNGEIIYNNISESNLVTPADFLSPNDNELSETEKEEELEWLNSTQENYICDECLDEILRDSLDDTEQLTSGNCLYTIFPDDEDPAVHIEIDLNYLWTSDDIWELIDDLAEWANIMEEAVEEDFPGVITGTIESCDGLASWNLGNGTLSVSADNLTISSSSTDSDSIENIKIENPNNINLTLKLDTEDFRDELENLGEWAADKIKGVELNFYDLKEDLDSFQKNISTSLKSIMETLNLLNEERKNIYNLENKKPKPLLILTTPCAASDKMVKQLKEYAKKILLSANIDAEPIVLADGLQARFLQPE